MGCKNIVVSDVLLHTGLWCMAGNVLALQIWNP